MKRYEVWACFPDGIKAKVESHASRKSARNAVDAMNSANRHEVAEGYGFPHGVPSYVIVEI